MLDGAICTLSNELAQTGARDAVEVDHLIKSGSDEFFMLWERGWAALLEQLDGLGKRSRLMINKVFWSQRTEAGMDYAPAYDPARIRSANDFLQRLYQRMELDLDSSQLISFEPELLVGASQHKWGLSPFHFIQSYYLQLASRMTQWLARDAMSCEFSDKAKASTAGRNISAMRAFGMQHGRVVADGGSELPARFTGNGKVQIDTDEVQARFGGAPGVYELRLNLGQVIPAVNGMTACYCLSDWEQVNYLAIGYTVNGAFHHVKLPNSALDVWVEVAFGSEDLIFGLQSRWKEALPTSDVADLRLYVKGTPRAAGARIGFRWGAFWTETAPAVDGYLSWRQQDECDNSARRNDVLGAIARYVRNCNPLLDEHVQAFLESGRLPMTGEQYLDWPVDAALPEGLHDVGTYRYLWHSMRPALSLMVYGRELNHLGAIFAARDYIASWLERSFFATDPDIKFAWYDHGTAERLLALVLMHELGRQYRFDARFMSRLRLVIQRHGFLLESEAFYAFHQPTRYHNHAWFQDMALIAAAQVMDDFPSALRWLQRGVLRLTDQLNELIARDNGYAIFVENSIGYHHGIQRLVEFAGELVSFSGSDSVIPTMAQELLAWSACLCYPDGRSPSQGDTFRRANLDMVAFRGRPYLRPECVILPKAGYAVAKGNHGGLPFMLCVFATSLCKTHKHEDNLSFTLYFDGVEWFIDPSFHSHEYTQPIPTHLRSAWAHNTVAVVDGRYSIEPGVAVLSGSAENVDFRISGQHDAYDAFKVSRHIDGQLDRLSVSVADHLSAMSGEILPEAYSLLQCGEGVIARIVDDGVELTHPASTHTLFIESANPVQINSGWQDGRLIQGVSGGGFMQAQDISVVAFRLSALGDSNFTIGVR
jgi:hypothetical protein